ncbi:MAG: dipicolinate synthase subunit B [Firmicutes bacterium]|jgi:dipicolinate synthase subunit B|nr:dipicolinate synthase subunit B [Bacillota bacterium]HPU00689.1 dipicolinate synthase subunit B [Bacillota bacterium]
MSTLKDKRIGVALTGSHCTIEAIMPQLEKLAQAGAQLFPILSPAVQTTDTRFGTAAEVRRKIEQVTGREPWTSIVEVEPIGPQKLLDLLLIAPCSGNTMAKLANGIVDTAVLMAAKAQLRNGRPLLLSISTNDGLGLNAPNLARLLNTKHIFMVPFGQDNPAEKPNSLVAKADLVLPAAEAALEGRQLQPILVSLA